MKFRNPESMNKNMVTDETRIIYAYVRRSGSKNPNASAFALSCYKRAKNGGWVIYSKGYTRFPNKKNSEQFKLDCLELENRGKPLTNGRP